MVEELKDQVVELKAKVSKLEEQMLKVQASVAATNAAAQLRGQRPREFTDIVCDSCGKKDRVNFKPTEGRPVYCRECFQKHRSDRRR